MNNKYTIRVGHPILRPGLTIETESSGEYVESVVVSLMNHIRKINDASPPTVREVLDEFTREQMRGHVR